MNNKIVLIIVLLAALTGAFNTFLNFPYLQYEFLNKPFFPALYNNIGLVIFGPALLITGVVLTAIYLWIKMGKRDKNL